MSSFFKRKKKKQSKEKVKTADNVNATAGVSSIAPTPSGTTSLPQEDQETIVTNVASTSQHRLAPNPSVSETLDVVEQLFTVIKEISEATDLLSPLKSACALIIRGTQTTRNIHANRTAWLDLCDNLTPQISQMEAHREQISQGVDLMDQNCLSALESYLSVVTEIFQRAVDSASQQTDSILQTIRRGATAQHERDEIADLHRRLESAWEIYKMAMNHAIIARLSQIEKHVESYQETKIHARRNVIPSAREAYDMGPRFEMAYGDRVDTCEEGTRTHILSTIRTWAADYETEKKLFWLNDAAGTGKSTIAATVAKEWKDSSRLLGRFFFSPNANTTTTTKDFCLAVAEDMAANQPSVKQLIQTAIRDTPLESYPYFDSQFQRLVLQPLRSLSVAQSMFLVIDALDNCVDLREREELVETLLRHLPSTKSLKVFLTSRPLQDITIHLHDSPVVYGSNIQLLDIHAITHTDVALYVDNRLRPLDGISKAHRDAIVNQSGGLFLYASTICRMLEKSRRLTQVLDILLDSGSPQRLANKMDALYLSVLKQAEVDKSAREFLMAVLSIIIIVFQPISTNTISIFLPTHRHIDDFVQDLGGVLKDGDPDRPIKVLHPTFREFVLSNQDRANGFLVNPTVSHAATALGCLRALNEALRYDILQVQSPDRLLVRNMDIPNIDRLIYERTTAAVRYASAFWADHVIASDVSVEIWSNVFDFLHQKFLNWVELMSWRGSVAACIQSLSHMRTEAKWISAEFPDILKTQDLTTIRHAHHYVVQHQTMIAVSAMHNYSVALAFTPTESPLFKGYRKQFRLLQPTITTSHSVRWGNHLTLGGKGHGIDQVLFSPDGSRLVSFGSRGVLYLWDTETGATVGSPITVTTEEGKYMSFGIQRCNFSLDGTRLGVYTKPGNTYLCLPVDGQPSVAPMLWKPVETTHKENVTAFSPSLTYIASGGGSSIRIFDLEAKSESHLLQIDKGNVLDVAFSPDNQKLVCVTKWISSYRTICSASLFNLATSEYVSVCQIDGRDKYYDESSIVFSANCSRFTTWLSQAALQLHDTSTGEILAVMEEMRTDVIEVPSVLFCPRGQHIAYSTPLDSRVIVRKQSTGELTTSLDGHTAGIIYTSFDRDGHRLVSVSYDQTVRVWSIPSGEALESIFTGFTGHIKACALSMDWRKFSSVSFQNQLNIHDLREGHIGEPTFESDSEWIAAISLAAPLIVTKGTHAGARIWDVSRSECLGAIAARQTILSACISPDDRMVATRAMKSLANLWNIKTLAMIGDLSPGKNNRAGNMLFSPDSRILGVPHEEGISIWDTRQNGFIWHSRSFKSEDLLAFTPDSTRYVSSNDSHISVWSIGSKTCVQSARKKSGYNRCLFSPVDQSLFVITETAAVSSLEIWRMDEELQLVSEISLGRDIYYGLTFSSDGKYLAYGTLCWDMASMTPVAYTGRSWPSSLKGNSLRSHPFLRCEDGWVHSAFPDCAVMPIPSEFWRGGQSSTAGSGWHAFGNTVLLLSRSGEPLLIDCDPVLSRATSI